jgi:HemK-like putative methylase
MKDEKRLLEEKYGGQATAEYEKDRERLARGEPLAYVIGWQPFLGLKIFLDSRPLIPRSETEHWTEQLIGTMNKWSGLPREARTGDPRTFVKSSNEVRFLDLCAGSGAIGCAALKYLSNAEVYFGEVDPAHEETIRKNIRENGLDESRAHICIGDLFAPLGNIKFDIIAANPPYVPEGRELPASVGAYEPPGALFSGAAGLDLIKRIAGDLPAHLAPDGEAWIECDSEHAEAARDLFATQGFSAEIRTDQYEKPRMIVVSYT